MKKFFQMLLNPVFIIVYWIFLYVFLKLCKYGKGYLAFDMPILIICVIVMCVWLAVCITLFIVKKEYIMIKWEHWLKIALTIMIASTLYSGYRVYDMITHKNGKISYYYDKVFREKEMTFHNTSMFDNGFNDFMEEAKVTMAMPNELYISENVNIKCGYDGRISSFYMFVYGKKDGGTKSYLISYKDGEKAKFRLDGYADLDYSEDKKLQPFLDTLKNIEINDYIEPFQLQYSGVQNFGYNNENTYYVDKTGKVIFIENLSQEIQGYTTILEPLSERGPRTKTYIYMLIM